MRELLHLSCNIKIFSTILSKFTLFNTMIWRVLLSLPLGCEVVVRYLLHPYLQSKFLYFSCSKVKMQKHSPYHSTLFISRIQNFDFFTICFRLQFWKALIWGRVYYMIISDLICMFSQPRLFSWDGYLHKMFLTFAFSWMFLIQYISMSILSVW